MFSALTPVGEKITTQKGPEPPSFPGYQAHWLDSGTSALALALLVGRRLKQVTGRPQVILPAYGCPDLVAAAVYAGCEPVLVDIGEQDPGYDLEALQEAFSANTVAVIAVNFLGIRERLASIRDILPPGVLLIEDNAQWLPESELQGDMVALSFNRGKPASIFGGGGLLVADRLCEPGMVREWMAPALPDPKRTLKIAVYNQLSRPSLYYWVSRLSFLGLGETRYQPLESVRYMDPAGYAILGSNVELYRNHAFWREAELDGICSESDAVTSLPVTCTSRRGRLLRYPILLSSSAQREWFLEESQKRGLGTTALYGMPLRDISGVKDKVAVSSPLKNVTRFAQCLLTMPLHSQVSENHLDQFRRLIAALV